MTGAVPGSIAEHFINQGIRKGMKEGIKEGMKEGIKEGIKEGKEKGEYKKTVIAIRNMTIKESNNADIIAEFLSVDP